MKLERKQVLTKREFLAESLATAGGLLLSSDSGFAFEGKDQGKIHEGQNKTSTFSEKHNSFLQNWRGLVITFAAAVGITELHSRARKSSAIKSLKDIEPLLPTGRLYVERRVERLEAFMGSFKIDEKLVKKQLRFLHRSYKNRALRVLNNPEIIPFGREGEWIFLIDSGLYCTGEAEMALKEGDLKRASLLLAIADEDRIILNRESWKYQNQISFEELKKIDIEQGTFKYSSGSENKPRIKRVRRQKTYLEVIEDKRSAILFHTQIACYLRAMIAKEEPLSDEILDRILETEISIAKEIHKFLVLPRQLVYGGYGGGGQENSQAEGLFEEIGKKLRGMLRVQADYQQFSRADKLLAYWSLARTIEKFRDFERKVLGEREEVVDEKGNLAGLMVQS